MVCTGERGCGLTERCGWQLPPRKLNAGNPHLKPDHARAKGLFPHTPPCRSLGTLSITPSRASLRVQTMMGEGASLGKLEPLFSSTWHVNGAGRSGAFC